MGGFITGDRVTLIDDGTASAGESWRGGRGAFILWGATVPSGGISLQMSPDNGTTWITVPSIASGDPATVPAAATSGLINFELPPCRIRANPTLASANAIAVGT